jgi:tRNA-Thr(GGU) m(6)t(6)A37 methyltransferase TsaA
MKASTSFAYGSYSVAGNIWGIPIVVAVCSLTVAMAWSAASTNSRRSVSRSISLVNKTLRRLECWYSHIPVSNVESKRTSRLHSNTPYDNDNESNKSSNESKPKDISERKGRFTTIEDTMMANDGNLQVRPIGTVRSVYRLCVGTPRQGMLAPHARARIELHNMDDDRTGVAAAASVDGLQHFSHVWIVFIFHLNTVGKHTHSKIAPPALGGSKVGVLATRSPHRLNPIGMTLAKLDAIRMIPQPRTAEGRKQGPMTVLEISGSDLVDGTPVLDIKPYVPTYDAVASDNCVVPEWVSEGLSTARPVHFTERAENELRNIVANYATRLEFYGNPTIPSNCESVYESIKACIQEVLAVDVRSRHQTNKARLGLSRAEKADRLRYQEQQTGLTQPSTKEKEDVCTQQLDNLLVSFTVTKTDRLEREESIGSGAEDRVTVESIHLLDA